MDKVWITLTILATLVVSLQTANETNSQQWPKVFFLSKDPNYTVVCYSGVAFNQSESDTAMPSTQDSATTEKNVTQNIYTLSTDPSYPVTCREAYIPANLTDDNSTSSTEEENELDFKCIRRDYEKNISAIFLHKAGPLQLALNIFNSTIPYGYMTVTNIDSIGAVKVLNETVVDCGEYGITTVDKGICPGAAASLCG